ncbi:hypothetical protein F5Y16DRAFT_384692 [Xylariaceae sp. FL0255]|nr:hypothetical protein F5Y16DRAFT_384692 [Xylariaceae sp. FL0255]
MVVPKTTRSGEDELNAESSSSNSRVGRQIGTNKRDSNSVDTAPTAAKESAQKRRRRAFSCLSCQKLKCRCEFESGAQGCHRCSTLRIACSLRGQNSTSTSPSSAGKVEPLSLSSVEERLQRNEQSLAEIKSLIQGLKSGQSVPKSASLASLDQATADQDEEQQQYKGQDPEYFSSPVDKHTDSAPVAVLRRISQQVTLGRQRLLGDMNLDLIQQGLLDNQTASELLEYFFKQQGHHLFVRTADEVRPVGDIQIVSGFLHSVCYLIGVVYHDEIRGTQLHRQIYDQVRIMLGQALLSSPLHLDDLNAVFIMSNNANTPNSQGCEYIDSWLLTGYCAKQAMLSISFSKMVSNIKKGISTAEDYKIMHLWSSICLHHLQWAATTGRASVIPTSYLNQCNILLSFYQATMQDGMLVAEIMLYTILHRKLSRQSFPHDGRECEEFLAWKQRWNHLLTLSTSSMLQIGYHAACLILVVRTLEDTGHALGPQSLLSTDNTGTASLDHDEPETPIADIQTGVGDQYSQRPLGSTPNNDFSKSSSSSSTNADTLRANGCKHAARVLEIFLQMPSFVQDASPTCTSLCIGYCVLLLAHYDSTQSTIPDSVVWDLVTRIDHWVRTSPGKAWSYKYGILARKKMENRTAGVGRESSETYGGDCLNVAQRQLQQAEAGERGQRGDRGRRQRRDASLNDGTSGHGQGQDSMTAGYHPPIANDDDALLSATDNHQSLDLGNGSMPFFEMSNQTVFPSMEDFFGGGFLDFIK